MLLFIVGVCAAVVSAFFGGDDGTGGCLALGPTGGPVAGLSAEQTTNAAVIVQVGQTSRIPPRGWVIAVAVALQESDLVNLVGGDRDSVGLFQQRPSQGWGSTEQLHDPAYAAGQFYARLVAVPDWQTIPLTEAAQAVQRSAYPDAYARHEARAAAIVQALFGGAGCGPAEVSAAGWTRPAPGPVVSGFRTPERPNHQGVDIGAPRATLIRAAAAGVVVTVVCNASTADGAPVSCDTDGSADILGCGWYLEILHPGDVVSRYCHQLRRPIVHVGQSVVAGQPIGWVGTSGNSSGPHLHFEVHVGYPATNENATDPESFMRERGAALQ